MADSTMPTLTSFTEGDIVISISGDGAGTGTYGDNQASPLTLEELTPDGAVVGQMVLPQTTTVVDGVTEYAVSAEYGSSSEGSLSLSADGQSLVIAGYGINADTFNAGGAAVYGNAALAQSTSVPGGPSTAVARVIADISYNGAVDTSTALYDIDNLNNPRSVATVNGTSFYVSGQGTKGDTTQGVQYAEDGASTATAVDDSTDTRTAEIVDGVLYVSRDSTQGSGGTSSIASYGGLPTGAAAAVPLTGIDGTVSLTAAQENGVNNGVVGTAVHLSPENFFFASSTVLYVADGGNPKEDGLGDGGLQKWLLTGGAWTLQYTLSAGLGLVADTAASGSTGLIGLTGSVAADGNVTLYATNSTIQDLDPTALYSITDSLAATAPAVGEAFTTVLTAPADSNIRGVAFAPSAAAAAPTAQVVSGSTMTGTDLTVTSGSTLTVEDGGTIVGATILASGSATISAGSTDSGSTIAQGGQELVLGSATGDQVEGTQILSAAGAVASDETVYNGGAVDLFLKGATASLITIETGGALAISGAATAANLVIEGGVVTLESAKAALAGSLTFSGAGELDVMTVLSAGSLGSGVVISGFGAGDVLDTAMTAGATLSTAVAGGNTVATITNATVTESFTFAGTATDLALQSDGGTGMEIVTSAPPPPAGLTVSSGVTSAGLTVASGTTVSVLSGGRLVDATVQNGGSVFVDAGGTDSGSTLAAGSFETVLGGVTGDMVFGSQLVSAAGAFANSEMVQSGGVVDLFLKGVTASGLVVEAGGTVNVNGNVDVTGTVLSGGVLDLQSPKATLEGSLTFAGPATLEVTDVSSAGFGDLAVISGFAAGDVIDDTAIGATAAMSTMTSGGNTVVTISGTTQQSYIFAGIRSDLQLGSDGAHGVEITAAATTPTHSSVIGTVTGLSVTSGSTVDVLSGGTLSGATVLWGGVVTVEAGGTDAGSTLAAGSNETVIGTATGDQVAGTQFVSAGSARLNGETVLSGGLVELELKGIVASGMVVQAGGTLEANGNITISDAVLSGGVIELQSPKATLTGSLTFAHGGTLALTDISTTSTGDQAVISSFTAGDVIDDTVVGSGAVLSGSVVSGNTVETITSGSVVQSFTFAGPYDAGYFSLVPDGGAGVEITAEGTPCYCRGTLILTGRGEMPVEALAIGDLLRVRDGALRAIKWIGRRSYSGRFAAGNREVLPVVFRAGSLADGVPRRDLAVSPMHAMFVGGALVPAGALVNGASIVQAAAIDRVAYFHLELDSHDVIFAEGAESETFIDDDSRGMFHNAAEYGALHPDAPAVAVRYYAPRVESGAVLQAVRDSLAARAGVSAAPVGMLKGQIEAVSRAEIRFWAWDGTDAPVRLRVIDNGVVLGEAVAEAPRADLAAAGIGGGAHGCVFTVPGGLSPALRHVIEVERVADGARLAHSPWVLDEAGPVAIAAAPAFGGRGQVDVVSRERVAGWVMDPADPAPVALQILDNGMPIASVLANGYRADLAAACVGTGWHAFDVAIPGGLSPLSRHVISVRAERDGAELPGCPVVIEAADRFDAGLEAAVAQAVGAVGSAEERRRVLSFIAAQAARLVQLQADDEARPAARLAAWQLRRTGEAVEVAPRALVIAARLVDGPHVRALRELGYAVSFVAAEEMGVEAALEGVSVCGAPFYASVEEVLRRQADGFAVVVLEGVAMASRYLTLARALAPRARVVFGAGSLRHLALARQAAAEERPELAAASRRVQMEEFRAAWAADAVVVGSAAEAAVLRRGVPEAVVVGGLGEALAGAVRRAG